MLAPQPVASLLMSRARLSGHPEKRTVLERERRERALSLARSGVCNDATAFYGGIMLHSSCTGKLGFPTSEWEISTGMPPEVGIPSRKVGESSPPPS